MDNPLLILKKELLLILLMKLINRMEKQINTFRQYSLNRLLFHLNVKTQFVKCLLEIQKKGTSFDDIFTHPCGCIDQIDFRKSVLQTYVPQHQEFIKNLSRIYQEFVIYSLIIKQLASLNCTNYLINRKQIQRINLNLYQFQKYFDLIFFIYLIEYYLFKLESMYQATIKLQIFQLLIFLANLYEIVLKNQNINISFSLQVQTSKNINLQIIFHFNIKNILLLYQKKQRI
ncbi:unnamed protein product [Paramecium sonneborni]|uniref:Uncharacterized protein n=1 Tax=Paramecium sonneborni TaxID=65129 RepID=A0A8S1N1P4_9CILI|nr:unnamed protein product [Paramecium sonneborni]CAD8086530.1 unnamed protein product [Paramecium sonneborni]